MSTLSITPVGTELEGEWEAVGHVDGTLATFHLDPPVRVEAGEPVTMKMPVDLLDGKVYRMLTGNMEKFSVSRGFQMAVRREHEPLTAPAKRRGLTGKAYRIARRRYRRQRTAWLRAGAPMLRTEAVFPRARLDSVERVSEDTLSIGFIPLPNGESHWFEHVDGPTRRG